MKNLDNTEVGSISREIYIEAAPQIVFDVISRPEHVARWWPDAATYQAAAGSTGTITFGDPADGGKTELLTILEVEPPTTFTFRWTQPSGEHASADNSLLVTFELAASGLGTLLTFTETGFRETGWDEATQQAVYDDHVNGWNHFLPRLAPYAESLGAAA